MSVSEGAASSDDEGSSSSQSSTFSWDGIVTPVASSEDEADCELELLVEVPTKRRKLDPACSYEGDVSADGAEEDDDIEDQSSQLWWPGSGAEYNPVNCSHDPDWIDVCNNVQTSPDNAYGKLSHRFRAAESPTAASALLSRLLSCVKSTAGESGGIANRAAVAIMQSVFHVVNCEDNRNSTALDLARILVTEVGELPKDAIYMAVEDCLDYLRIDKDRDGSLAPLWIELFSKMVTTLMEKRDVKLSTNDGRITGDKYGKYIVAEICKLNWNTTSSPSLLSLLAQIPGLKKPTLKIILQHAGKIANYIEPTGFPPFVYQLLQLVGKTFPRELLSIAERYFALVDHPLAAVERRRNVLCTVVIHFIMAARYSNELVKAVSGMIKSSYLDLRQSINPFTLSVSLGLASVEHKKDTVIDALVKSIMARFRCLERRKGCYIYNRMIGPTDDEEMELSYGRLLESSFPDPISKGIFEFGFGLLSVERDEGKEMSSTIIQCHNLGSTIITSLLKREPDQFSCIVKKLLSSRSPPFTECLAMCLKSKSRLLFDPALIGTTCEIIQQLPMMNSDSAPTLVMAMSTALQLNKTLLDSLINELRKNVLKSTEARKTIAKILLVLLSKPMVVGEIATSQYSETQRYQSSRSTSSKSLSSDQPLCIELLTFTRRWVEQQQREVKTELYMGFPYAVRENPGICELVSSQLLTRANQFISAHTSPPSMLFAKLFQARGRSIEVIDELGFLIQCISNVLLVGQKLPINDESQPEIMNALDTLLRSFVCGILSVNENTIKQDASDIVTTNGLETEIGRYVENVIIIQALHIIQALLEFMVYKENPSAVKIVRRLFVKHEELKSIMCRKPAKDEAKQRKRRRPKNRRTSDDDTRRSNDSSDTTAYIDASSAAKKVKPLDIYSFTHIFNLKHVHTMLCKLYSSDLDRHPLTSVYYTSMEFEKLLLGVVRNRLAKLKLGRSLHESSEQSDETEKYFAHIASSIWDCLLSGEGDYAYLKDNNKYDKHLKARLELSNLIVHHLCSTGTTSTYTIKLFAESSASESLTYDQTFSAFFDRWAAAIMAVDHKCHTQMFDILHAFSIPLSADSAVSVKDSRTVLNYLEVYMKRSNGNHHPTPELASSVMSCVNAYYEKGMSFSKDNILLMLSDCVRNSLGDNGFVSEERDQSAVSVWLINDTTSTVVLVKLVELMDEPIDGMLLILKHLKSRTTNEGDGYESVREEFFAALQFIIEISSKLVPIAFPCGEAPVKMLSLISKIFSLMAKLTEYTSQAHTSNTIIDKFIKLANLVSTGFENSVDLMIEYIKNVSQSQGETSILTKRTMTRDVDKLIPRLIYLMEKYDQKIITLSDRLRNYGGPALVMRSRTRSTKRNWKTTKKLI